MPLAAVSVQNGGSLGIVAIVFLRKLAGERPPQPFGSKDQLPLSLR